MNLVIKNAFDENDMKAFEPSEKIGIVACIGPGYLPHITLLTSIMARDLTHITIGQFCLGRSKAYMQENRNIAFLVMTLDRSIWRGKGKWTHSADSGPEYEMYNNMPLFRYNAYFGIYRVHYLELIETSEGEKLPLAGIIRGSLFTRIAKGGAENNKQRILKPFAEVLFNKLGSLKFLSYIGEDSFPAIIPIVQCQASGSRRLVFSPSVYKEELSAIPKGAEVAVFCMNLKMQSVLVRGTFRGFDRFRTVKLGLIDIEWVYNSMPPCYGQIYPEVGINPCEFEIKR
jgi:hypothetical protein